MRRQTVEFKLHAPYQATGDQPEAIAALVRGVELGLDEQVLLGVTGSGKTFTMASVIEKVQRPTLVLAHNKTLAAQLCAEFKEFFPENAVEYFVSYYAYYQPEAYIPHTDTYIAKDASTNEEIDRLRLSATCALLERRDVIVVSSVSCIYGLGEPDDFAKLMISLRPGQTMERDELLRRLVEDRYERNDVAFERNRFRVRGDAVDIYPAYWRDRAVRVEFLGDEIDAIREFQPVTGVVTKTLQHTVIYPASHYVTTKDKMERAIEEIERELEVREKFFTDNGQAVEAQRIHQRTRYDIEMMRELGYCTGIENYSRVISARPEGSAPMTLLDYFPKDFLLFVDESHVTLPQVRAMYNGDRARKDALVQYGFRLPCAYDNRPLRFEDFEQRVHQRIYVSATPGDYERERAGQMTEDDGVELRKRAGVAEYYIAQLLPVQSAVGGEDIAERGGQVGAQRRVGPEHFVIHRVAVEHQRAARAVVPPRAKGIGQERRAVVLAHRLVKFIQRAREHPLAQKLRLILVEHAEIGPQRMTARVLTQQVAVLAQQRRAEGVHRFDVRAVDTQQLPLQMRVERVLLQLFAENLGDLAAQLRRRGAGVGNDEKVVKVRFAALDVGKKPLDEHLRLAAARRGGHQQAPPAVLYRRLLLGGQDVSHRVFPLPRSSGQRAPRAARLRSRGCIRCGRRRGRFQSGRRARIRNRCRRCPARCAPTGRRRCCRSPARAPCGAAAPQRISPACRAERSWRCCR